MSQENNQLLDLSSLRELGQMNIAIVYTEWNEDIVSEQLNGAEKIAQELDIVITHKIAVPGSVELPFACKHLYKIAGLHDEQLDAIIAFGAVVRGDTPHFNYVCNMVSNGIAQLNLELDIPVIFGVLTVNSQEQAWQRLGGSHGHKGEESMITAAKMVKMLRNL